MDESLCIAYELKHQIENLPDEVKRSKIVDGAETAHDMLSKVAIVVHASEAHEKDIK